MKVHELLRSKHRWTQNVAALNKQGHAVCALDDSAVCWCLAGAIDLCYRTTNTDHEVRHLVQDALSLEWCGGDFICWQDHPSRTHAEVYQLVKELDI